MNSVMLVGRLTKDIELRQTGNGNAVTSFTIAVDRNSKEGGADFPRVTVFGAQAENCAKFLSKGRLIGVEGRLQTGSYEDKDGKKVYTTDVIAHRIEFLGSKKEAEEANTQAQFEALDEDVPF